MFAFVTLVNNYLSIKLSFMKVVNDLYSYILDFFYVELNEFEEIKAAKKRNLCEFVNKSKKYKRGNYLKVEKSLNNDENKNLKFKNLHIIIMIKVVDVLDMISPL